MLLATGSGSASFVGPILVLVALILVLVGPVLVNITVFINSLLTVTTMKKTVKRFIANCHFLLYVLFMHSDNFNNWQYFGDLLSS